MNSIRIQRASEHNLKDVSLEIPRGTLSVFTGVSGSGKSSLAFDTIYREGQRRFLESLSAYARQFLGGFEKPHVEHIEGLSPTVSVDQKTVGRSPRSTVGTITEIYDYLRLFFARLGSPFCPHCGREVAAQSAEQICDRVFHRFSGGNAMICAPVVHERKGEHRALLEELRREGHTRVLIDGVLYRLADPIPALKRGESHSIELVWDRLEVADRLRSRWVESIERCLALADGTVSVVVPDSMEKATEKATEKGAEGDTGTGRELFSSRFACAECGTSLPELEPRLFSFNSHHGACTVCEGLGETEQIDPELLVENASLPMKWGGLPFFGLNGRFLIRELDDRGFRALGKRLGFTTSSSWGDLDEAMRRAVLYGDGEYGGLIPLLSSLTGGEREAWVGRFQSRLPCPDCGGARLRPEARSVRVGGRAIHEVSAWSLRDFRKWLEGLPLSGSDGLVGEPMRRDMLSRLSYIEGVGLSYLSLDRRAATLAGGEAQRLRLGSQVGGGLQGILFVLDEPSIGLHPRDHGRLLATLAALRDCGNTVLVVEHDRATMEAADHLVDIGPGAGPLGGEILAEGSVGDLKKAPRSITGDYLAGRREIPVPRTRRTPGREWLELFGVSQNNLRGIDVRIPLGVFVVVSGVSGSGKSSLVNQVLRPALRRKLHGSGSQPGRFRSLLGHQHVDKVVEIDQAPIGRSPRSNPATYVKVFDLIRQLFTRVPEARARGYSAGRFSFNKDGGRCLECGGAGVTVVEMQFLAPVEVVCDACSGQRYNRETLEVRYRGKNIHDVLEMTIAEAHSLFKDHPKIRRPLELLERVGLGYMRLGQPSTTLSGGEAQRVKLAAELRKRDTGRTLYLLDEPTTGLHFEDTGALLRSLEELVDKGNSVLVIEHNPDVIKCADYIIDLGPEAGDEGGCVVATGTPEEVARSTASHTGRVLAPLLAPAPEGKSPSEEPPVPRDAWVSGRDLSRNLSRDIEILGACQHNLKGVDARIPQGTLTVITGVSGSGKTSLAFDTLFAEGQRRYLESLSTYARRFLGRLPAPEVREVRGLSPTIAIDQKSATSNPRSTVATITEIHDYLRLLYARVGHPHCPVCGAALEWTTPTRLAGVLVEEAEGRRLMVLAALDTGPVGTDSARAGTILMRYMEGVRADLLKSGFTRVLAAGEEVRLDEEGGTAVRRMVEAARQAGGGAGVQLVVDRIVASPDSRTRLAGSLELAFERGNGRAGVLCVGEDPVFHTRWPSCPHGHTTFREELSPHMFSYSSHHGACPVCRGIGLETRVEPEAIIPRPENPLFRALDPKLLEFMTRWRTSALSVLRAVCQHMGMDLEAPFAELPGEQQQAVLFGLEGTAVPLELEGGLRTEATWAGLVPQVVSWAGEDSWAPRVYLKRLLRPGVCSGCGGGRLRKESLAVRVGGRNLQELCAGTVRETLAFLDGLEFPPREMAVSEPVLREIHNRLEFLDEVGLGYLSLDRTAATLSGGESQRIRLASQLGNRLAGVLYVLDEPTVGLHQSDTERLLKCLRGLRDLGNTVLVVEHDSETLRTADWIIDMGPGPGTRGGAIVVSGTPAEVSAHPDSLTGRYLREGAGTDIRRRGRSPGQDWIRLSGIHRHNLDDLSVSFPLEVLTAVSGVSGSGKSTLVCDVLVELVRAFRSGGVLPRELCREATGLEGIHRLVVVDQKPIGRTPRSNVATYTGIWDIVRSVFAALPASLVRGFHQGRFSFNTGEGRCPGCDGQGARQVEMHFLSDVWVPCEHCEGRRFDPETLKILFKGKNVGDLLEMEVDEALEFFENQPRILRRLDRLQSVGLGYVKLGQSADTLSGGEAQRVKLSTELGARPGVRTLFVLDEPTTGLHIEDVRKLLGVLQALVDAGNTVVVIEHQLDVLRSADWIIDLGPGAGDDGGRVVAEGTPEQVAASAESVTGRLL